MLSYLIEMTISLFLRASLWLQVLVLVTLWLSIIPVDQETTTFGFWDEIKVVC